MKQSAKTILGAAGFALLLVGAVVAYNALSKQVEPGADTEITQAQGGENQASAESGIEITQARSEGSTQPQSEKETQSQAQTQPPSSEQWNGTDFTVTDANGKAVRLSDLRGKPVVLNFWASWCPPCRQEMPEFDSAHRELGGEIQFMMVDLTDGARETVKTATQFVRDQGYGFPVYFDTKGEAAGAYGITGIPATFFIDGQGRVVSSKVGALSKAALLRGIDGIR